MQYLSHYDSPLGHILMAADEVGLTGLWLEGQKHYAKKLPRELQEVCMVQDTAVLQETCWTQMAWGDKSQMVDVDVELPIFTAAKCWLDQYFSGQVPKVEVPIHLEGTDFQKEVWQILCEIPYGQTTTYSKIAKEVAAKRGVSRMSAQAVGGAVGHNPISIIVPCHRVIGSDGSLTGYAGGIDKKIFMLELERKQKNHA